jgi:hypothetical protein
MSRNTLRTLLALCALALAVSVPAIALAHNHGRPQSSNQGSKTVGTIASFTDPTLVVTSGGMPVSGAVTGYTRIKWAGRGRHRGWYGHGRLGHASHFVPGGGPNHDWTQGGMPTEGGMPTQGGMPTEGGMPTQGGMPPSWRPSRATTADLKPGTVVRAADLVLTPNGPVWSDIVLVPAVQTPPA